MFPNASALALSNTYTNKINKQVMKIINFKMDSTMYLKVYQYMSNIELVGKNIKKKIGRHCNIVAHKLT